MRPGPSFQTVKNWVSYGFIALAGVLLVWYVVGRWGEFSAAIEKLTWVTLAGSVVVCAVGLLVNALSWREAMVSASHRFALSAALRTYFISQLGKYIPGSVWPALAQMEMMKRQSLTRSQSLVGSSLALVIGGASSAVVACGLLVFADRDSLARYWWLVIVGAGCAIVLIPAVLRRLLAWGSRLHQRLEPFGRVPIAGRPLVGSMVFAAVSFLIWGQAGWILAVDMSAGNPHAELSWPAFVGGWVLAWLVGFVIVIAPGGIGPREAALVVVWGPMIGVPEALAIAVVMRVELALVDALGAGVAALIRRRTTEAISPIDQPDSQTSGDKPQPEKP
jgi:uncharacterized membrane protein YbhN (UPF0104 family)